MVMAKVHSFERQLTSREAARLLGVSEASVKRWADSGLLPTAKTAGGHRRFRPEDIAIFRRQGVIEKDPTHDDGTKRRAARVTTPEITEAETERAFYEAVLEGRGEQAAAILVRLHLNGSTVARLADSVICPAMRRVGDLWHRGDLSVAQEHVATRAAHEALGALRTSINHRKPHGKRAICCATESDFHELPVQMAVLTLEEHGWEVINLGSSTPFYSLAESVERYSPRLVCVASTMLEGLDRAARDYSILSNVTRKHGNALVMGGVGLTHEDVRDRFPADLHASSFEDLESFIGGIVQADDANAVLN